MRLVSRIVLFGSSLWDKYLYDSEATLTKCAFYAFYWASSLLSIFQLAFIFLVLYSLQQRLYDLCALG